MSKASVADLTQMFSNTVSIYKNKPYYILDIGNDYRCRARNLMTQREEVLPINEDDWGGPTQRLGYMNIMDTAVYVSRKPVRRYKAGLSKENLVIEQAGNVEYPRGSAETLRVINSLVSIEMGDCIMGKYPSFEEACLKVKQGLGITAIAFDRQFAVNARGNVFYKGLHVGKLKARPKTVNDIEFKQEYTYLVTLLENNYEKALSTPRS